MVLLVVMMTTKQVRITVKAEEIVKAYSGQDSLSRGIEKMQTAIDEESREIVKLRGMVDRLVEQKREEGSKQWDVTTSHDEDYWNHLEAVVRKAMKPAIFTATSKPEQKRSLFQPASEKYEEPLDKHGRPV